MAVEKRENGGKDDSCARADKMQSTFPCELGARNVEDKGRSTLRNDSRYSSLLLPSKAKSSATPPQLISVFGLPFDAFVEIAAL